MDFARLNRSLGSIYDVFHITYLPISIAKKNYGLFEYFWLFSSASPSPERKKSKKDKKSKDDSHGVQTEAKSPE